MRFLTMAMFFILCFAICMAFGDSFTKSAKAYNSDQPHISERVISESLLHSIFINTALGSVVVERSLNLYLNPRNAQGFFAAENLEKHYPWIFEHIYFPRGIPRFYALNKWIKPIQVSIGYPNDLRPFGDADVKKFLLRGDYPDFKIDEEKYNNAEKIVADEVDNKAVEVSQLIQLPVKFITHKDETLANYAGIRIILLNPSQKKPATFKKGSSRSAVITEGDGEIVLFRDDVAERLLSAVSFTPDSSYQVDVFFCPMRKTKYNSPFASLARNMLRIF